LLNLRTGFTLLEMLTSIMIVAILAIASVPLFTSFMQNYRLSAAADGLYYSLQYARSEAVKRNTNVYVSFTSGNQWCYGINTGSACNCNVAANCNLGVQTYSTSTQMTLSVSGLTSGSMYFEGTHGSVNAAGSVTFTQYGQTSPLITLSIGRLGGLKVCSTGISRYAAC
jgi:prepilin-type N-terminal cleavage/methylation domain-containing protein